MTTWENNDSTIENYTGTEEIDAKLSPRGMRERMERQRLISRDLLEN